MKRILLALIPLTLVAAVPACSTLNKVANPGAIASQTTADEKAAIGCEAVYQGYNLVLTNMVSFGKLDKAKGKALDTKGYTIVGGCRSAYRLGQSTSLAEDYANLKLLAADIAAAAK